MTRLQEIRSRVEKATPGPWKRGQPTFSFPSAKDIDWDAITFNDMKPDGWFDDNHVSTPTDIVICTGDIDDNRCHQPSLEDVDFIAAAREDVPFLLELVDEAVRLLSRHTWVEDASESQFCDECESLRRRGHKETCALAALLRRVEE